MWLAAEKLDNPPPWIWFPIFRKGVIANSAAFPSTDFGQPVLDLVSYQDWKPTAHGSCRHIALQDTPQSLLRPEVPLMGCPTLTP